MRKGKLTKTKNMIELDYPIF